MFGLKIFVRVQTFRRGPPVPPHNFCHPGCFILSFVLYCRLSSLPRRCLLVCVCILYFMCFCFSLLYLLPLVSRSVARKVQKGSSAAGGNPTGHFFDYYPSASLPITVSLYKYIYIYIFLYISRGNPTDYFFDY